MVGGTRGRSHGIERMRHLVAVPCKRRQSAAGLPSLQDVTTSSTLHGPSSPIVHDKSTYVICTAETWDLATAQLRNDMLLPRIVVIINRYVDKKTKRFKKEKKSKKELPSFLSVVRSSPKTTRSVRRHANMSRLFALEVVLQKLC